MSSVGQVATIGLAGLGFFFGGPTGAAIGWLAGSWLFSERQDQGNEIFDPGAQELPGFNQALRGVTIPVLFGTNRVETQHTWRKNFEAIRHESKEESGAGGKSGGSGGGSKAPASAGGGSVSYTYKLDVMFHMGFTVGDYFLYGGWLGNQRINDQTINAIGQGFASFTPLFGASTDVPKEASLEYDEAHFYPGGTEAAGWTYFLNQENIPVTSTDTSSLGMRWKGESWVGFRGLDLGQSPNVPLLQWEIGPGGGVLTLEDGLYGIDTVRHNATADGHAPMTVSKNGKWYAGIRDGDVYAIFADGTTYTEWENDVGVLVRTELQSEGIDHSKIFNFFNAGAIIPGTNYLLCHATAIGVGTSAFHGFILIDLSLVPDNTDPFNASYVIGWAYQEVDGLQEQLSSMQIYGLEGSQDPDTSRFMIVWQVGVGANQFKNVARLPFNANDMRNVYDSTDPNVWANNKADLTVFGSPNDGFPGTGSHSETETGNWGFFLPNLTIGVGIEWGTYLCWFVGRSHIDSSSAAYTVAKSATYPNGFMARVDLGITEGQDEPIVESSETVINDSFLDIHGAALTFPFLDEAKGVNGDDDTNGSYRHQVHFHKWSGLEMAGGYLAIFNKQFYGADNAPVGTNHVVKAFVYNPLADTFRQIAQAGPGFVYDTVVDAGQPEIRRHVEFNYSLATFSEDTKKLTLFYATNVTGGGSDPLHDMHSVGTFGTLDIGGAVDVTPPEIIREILTHDLWGMGYDSANIDETSYALAVQYCESQNFRVSTKYRREQGHLRILDMLLSLYGGYLIRRGDTIIFGVMDFGQTTGAAPVRTLDNDHFITDGDEPPIVVTEGAQQDTYNRVKVNYFDRRLEYRQNFVEENDEVDQDFRGIRSREFPAQFVMSEVMARKIAQRGLWSNLYARDKYSFFIGWKDMDLEPGDLVTLVDSFDPKLSAGVRARFNTIEEMEPGKWRVQATQELEHVVTADPDINSSTNPTSVGFGRGPTGAAHLFNMYELPKEFQGADSVTYVGWAQSERSMGAKLWVSGDGVSFSLASDITPHTISGIFGEGLPTVPRGTVHEDVDVYLFPDVRSAPFNPNSPAYVETFALEDGGETQRSVGGTALWVGSEMVAYQNPTIIGSNHYRFEKLYRGWGGTPIQDHSSGDFFWRHGGGVFTQVYNEDKIGTTVFYKVTPYNFSGFIWPVDSVDAKQYTIQGTYHRPQIPGNVHIWVDSADYTQTTKVGITNLTSKDFKAEWEDSSRCEGYGVLGYGFAGYGHFATDPLSHSWRAEVVGSGDTVVHSTVVTTPFFVYSAGQNFADNGAFRPNVTIKITPFGAFGDALLSEVVSLEFFGA